MENKGQKRGNAELSNEAQSDSFVLEKSIFSNVFDKDIRRVYIYKKAERLARAVHLIAPGFSRSSPLQIRAEEIAIALVDAAVLPPASAREALSRQLLALSSILAIARTGGLLSPMNADLVAREAHLLLEEVASYDEPRVALPSMPTLAEFLKASPRYDSMERTATERPHKPAAISIGHDKGHISDKQPDTGRRESILALLGSKGPSYIKDISTVIRNVSEKTIQRELQAMVTQGLIRKEGERRWTRYSLPS